jgi:hypothetical protein
MSLRPNMIAKKKAPWIDGMKKTFRGLLRLSE